MKKPVILVGYFQEIYELCLENNIEIAGYIDNKIYKNTDIEYLGSDEDILNIRNKIKDIPLVLTPDKPALRKLLYEKYLYAGYKNYMSIVSQFSKVAESSVMGTGSVVQKFANVSSSVKMGSFVKVNTMANIMHDSYVGNFTTVAPNAVILGRAKIGDYCYIGSNATILPNLEIGANSIIGAGAVVTKNIPDNKVYAGIPAVEFNQEKTTRIFSYPVNSSKNKLDISIVIPVRNEEKNLSTLVDRLINSLSSLVSSYEIIFVTDNNKDNTLGAIEELNRKFPVVKGIKLSNSFGQHRAVYTGLEFASGRYTVIMDGDLQDYPEDIKYLYAKSLEGYDLVFAKKERKNESRLRNFLSETFNKLLSYISDNNIDANSYMFRIISEKMKHEILRFRESDLSLTYVMGLINLNTGSVNVTSGKRLYGSTNYNFFRQIKLAITSIVSFSTKPVRIISFMGFFISFISFLFLLGVLIQKLFIDYSGFGLGTIMVLIVLFGGLILLAIGIIGEYIGRIFIQSKNRPLYIIEELIGKFN